MTGVANLVISMALALGACLLLSRSIGTRLSRKTLPNKLSGFRIIRKDEAILQEPLENLGRCHSAEKQVLILLVMEAFNSLTTQDKGERLTAAEGHLSSTWYS